MHDYFPVVVQVIPLDNYHVQVFLMMERLSNITRQIFCKAKYLSPYKIFKHLKIHVQY